MTITEFISIVFAILIAGLFPTAFYLSLNYRHRLSETRAQIIDLHLLWDEVWQLNQQVMNEVRKSGGQVIQGPRERTYREWGEE